MGDTGGASDHSNTQMGLPPSVTELLPSIVITAVCMLRWKELEQGGSFEFGPQN